MHSTSHVDLTAHMTPAQQQELSAASAQIGTVADATREFDGLEWQESEFQAAIERAARRYQTETRILDGVPDDARHAVEREEEHCDRLALIEAA
jgi:hypothetical protein